MTRFENLRSCDLNDLATEIADICVCLTLKRAHKAIDEEAGESVSERIVAAMMKIDSGTMAVVAETVREMLAAEVKNENDHN